MLKHESSKGHVIISEIRNSSSGYFPLILVMQRKIMNGVLKLSIFSTHVFLHEKRLLFMRRGRQGACLGMQIALENNLINVLTSSYLFFKKGVIKKLRF